jgi:hypothetical protein
MTGCLCDDNLSLHNLEALEEALLQTRAGKPKGATLGDEREVVKISLLQYVSGCPGAHRPVPN